MANCKDVADTFRLWNLYACPKMTITQWAAMPLEARLRLVHKLHPELCDCPVSGAESQRRRYARLTALAQSWGYSSWARFETDALAGRVRVEITPPDKPPPDP